MPELPEVETIKNQLIPEIKFNTIYDTFQSTLQLRRQPIPNLKVLIGQKILNISRYNKYIAITFNDYYLLIHLGMSGQLMVEKTLPNKKHIHAYFKFKDKVMYFQDTRRFGKIDIYSKNSYLNINDIPVIANLGLEPLSLNFTPESLTSLINSIKNKKTNIKKFIMDGSYICGIGNIYANEILFLSKIHPESTLTSLTPSLIKLLHQNIQSILNQAIAMGGSTISDFVHVNGANGQMQNYYQVYGRENKNCYICNNLIVRIKQQGRSTFFCSNCQHKY